MHWRGWSVLFLAGTGVSAHAMSFSGLHGTGVDDNDNLLGDAATDRHYSLADSPTSDAARTPLSGMFPLNGPYWLPDQTSSRWISPGSTINDTAPSGLYVYRTTFMLDRTNTSGPAIGDPEVDWLKGYRVRLWGRWSSDDVGLGVYLNGTFIGGSNYEEKPWAHWADFDTGFTNAMFREGSNTLEFRVTNAVFAGRNPTGIQTQVHGAFEAVPEPVSLSVLATGMLAVLKRRKKNRCV